MAFFPHIFITYTKFVFSYAFYSIASWERVERSHLRASIYANVLKNKQRFLHKNKVQFPQDRFTLFTLFTGSHYGTWKRTNNPPSTGRVTTSPGSASPTPFHRTVVWALLRPTRAKWKCCETGPTLYPPYPWLYTRMDAVSLFWDTGQWRTWRHVKTLYFWPH